MKNIYVLSGVNIVSNWKETLINNGQFALSDNAETLEELLKSNISLICESNYFNLFVIEKYDLNTIHPIAKEIKWFHYVELPQTPTNIKEIDKPDDLKHIFNFGIS